MCEDYETFSLLDGYKNGILYYNGYKIDLNEYLKGNIVVLDEDKKDTTNFFNLIDFDNSL